MGAGRRLAVVLGVAGLLLVMLGRVGGADEPPQQPGAAAAELWPLFGGDATRSAQGIGGAPYLEPQWRRALLDTERATSANNVESFLNQADRLLRPRQPAIPAAVPITVRVAQDQGQNIQITPLLVYRTYSGVQAVNPKNGKLVWEAQSKWGLENMASSSSKLAPLNAWMQFYMQPAGRPGIVFENSVLGTLSTDDKCVFAIEDLAVPPPSHYLVNAKAPLSKDLSDAINGNELQAFDLAVGKLKWKVGGTSIGVPLADSYFLGPPLPYQGSLYVLLETTRDTPAAVAFLCPQLVPVPDLLLKPTLCVARLDPATSKVLAKQAIFIARDPIADDFRRRLAAAHLAAADGVLVVPTNAGAVLGLDARTLKPLWEMAYVDWAAAQPNPPAPQFGPRPRGVVVPALNAAWKVTAPVIHDGRVVFAAPDDDRVRCVKLKDGAPVWSVKKTEDDLYLAGVYGDKVLIVGKRAVKALSLAKGEAVWDVETGVPGGVGVASDNVYYLPLRAAGAAKEPEVCAIDLATGAIVGHSRVREKNGVREAPGNIVFFDGQVLSQTTREVVAYPLLKTRLAEIDALLVKNPADPQGLTDRGEMRLNKGDVACATDDLRKALANKPAKAATTRARALLYEALTAYFQRDFDKAEPYLKEFEELGTFDTDGMAPDEKAKAAAEEKRRRWQFLLIAAKGREQQGKWVDALHLYFQIAEAGGQDELLPNPAEPTLKLSPHVWARQRIAEMLKNAPPARARELQDEIDKKWKSLRGGNDAGPLRAFIAVVGVEAESGREARLALAANLVEQKAYFAAEQYLEEVRCRPDDAARSGRAVYLLARGQEERGAIADALYYYRILARDYAGMNVAGGKTGKELFDALATDKRFLPFLDEAVPRRFGKGLLTVEEIKPPASGFQLSNPPYLFRQRGEALPFFNQYRVTLQTNTHTLNILSASGNEPPHMTEHLTNTAFAELVAIWNPQGSGQINPTHYFLNRGHLIVLPLGHMLFGIDPVAGKVLWEKSLYDPTAASKPVPAMLGNPRAGLPPVAVDPHDDDTVLVLYADGWTQRLGKSHPLLAGGMLIAAARSGLVALDPYSGKLLWQRNGVGRGDVFGDDDYVAVVEYDANGAPVATHVLRTGDGGTAKAADFHTVYAHRIRTVGRTVVVADKDEKQTLTLRRYDVATGKDVWKKSYPAKTLVVHTGDAEWCGVVEPDGTARLLDVIDGKETFALKVSPRHLDKVEAVRLFTDDQYLYLGCNRETDPDLVQLGGPQSNLMLRVGLRSENVNGELYAFDRATGAMCWHSEVPNQQLVLAHFKEMPVLVFTARYTRWSRGPVAKRAQSVVATQVIRKSNGKLCYDRTEVDTQQTRSSTQSQLMR